MFQQLRELMLLEDFKGCLPDNLVIHLNEQKVSSPAEAAILADEFVLTHRVFFPHAVRHEKVVISHPAVQGKDIADAVKAVRGGAQGGQFLQHKKECVFTVFIRVISLRTVSMEKEKHN